MVATFSVSNYQLAPEKTVSESGVQITTYWSIALPSTLGLNDILNFGYIPANCRVIGGRLKSTDIDSNGSPLVTFDIGDAGSATRYFSASTVGQAGTVDATMAAAGVFYKPTARTLIVGLVHAAAATAVAGTLELSITYICENSATSP